MQLVAYGAQDIYLTGNPQITFFKVVYRRHTNFSMEEIAQTENGSVTLSTTGTPSATYTISRNGDLVHKMYLQMDLSALAVNSATATGIVHNLINELECEIGGQKIDRQYGHWLEAWSSLTVRNDRGLRAPMTSSGASGSNIPITSLFADAVPGSGGMGLTLYDKMTGNAGPASGNNIVADESQYKKVHIPLQFWFNRNPGLALPLIALQYHEVKIKVSFNGVTTAAGASASAAPTGVKLFTQYIYLDTDERRRFAQVSHEYLIEQLQFQNEPASDNITLNFNHPVKELIWVGQPASAGTATVSSATITDGTKFQMKLNGHDRFSSRPREYFTRQQIYDHHTGFGGLTGVEDSIAVYSFALKPEEHQPSGTCNFSRIDTAQLVQTGTTLDVPLHVYAVNYNVLRIMSGMGGLAYSN